jgi:hypothetical protein
MRWSHTAITAHPPPTATAAGKLGCRCSKKWAAFQHLRQKVCLDGPGLPMGMPVGKLHAIQMVDTMIGGI